MEQSTFTLKFETMNFHIAHNLSMELLLGEHQACKRGTAVLVLRTKENANEIARIQKKYFCYSVDPTDSDISYLQGV